MLAQNRFNWLLIGLVILVGVLYVAPELLIWNKLHSLGKPYVAIQLTHHGDEAYGTISRFREIYDGHSLPGDLYFDEDAVTPFGPFQIMPLLMASFIYLFGGNINVSYLAATFFLTPLVFLLFYWLGKVITGRRSFAAFFALLSVMTPVFRALPRSFESISSFFNNIGNYFIPLVRTPLAKLPLGRMEDPLLTYLVFIPAIAAVLIFWRKPNWKTGALVGVLIGLMFYVYFHYWVSLVIIAGLIAIYTILRIKKNSNRFKSVLVLFCVLAIVTIPYWINFFTFQNSPTAAEVTARIGVETSRAPFFIGGEPAVFHYVFYILLAAFVYFVFYRREQGPTAALYWIFISSMLIVWNIQVVTGFVPSPDHWFRPISAFVFVILFHGFYELLKRLNYKIVVTCLIIGSALLVSKKIVNALVFVNPPREFIAERTFESRAFNSSIVESWDWINKNLPHEPKIISPSLITSLYLNAQTSARPYFAGGFNTAATAKLLGERFLTTYKLFKVRPEFLECVLKSNYSKDPCLLKEVVDSDPHSWINTANITSYLYVNDRASSPRSKEEADELIAAYSKISVTWKDIEADYIYYGPWEKQISQVDLSKDLDMELIFSYREGSFSLAGQAGEKNSEVEIYRIKK